MHPRRVLPFDSASAVKSGSAQINARNRRVANGGTFTHRHHQQLTRTNSYQLASTQIQLNIWAPTQSIPRSGQSVRNLVHPTPRPSPPFRRSNTNADPTLPLPGGTIAIPTQPYTLTTMAIPAPRQPHLSPTTASTDSNAVRLVTNQANTNSIAAQLVTRPLPVPSCQLQPHLQITNYGHHQLQHSPTGYQLSPTPIPTPSHWLPTSANTHLQRRPTCHQRTNYRQHQCQHLPTGGQPLPTPISNAGPLVTNRYQSQPATDPT